MQPVTTSDASNWTLPSRPTVAVPDRAVFGVAGVAAPAAILARAWLTPSVPSLPAPSPAMERAAGAEDGRVARLERELASLLVLNPGWDREGGDAPTLTAVWDAMHLARGLANGGLEVVGAAPSHEGGIVLNLIREGRAASIEVYNDRSATTFLYGARTKGTWLPVDLADPTAAIHAIRAHLSGA